MPIDHVLKLYSESIRSPYLHYGFWDEPELIDPNELTLDDMVKAQGRYIEHLASFIRQDVKTILYPMYTKLKHYRLMNIKKSSLKKNMMGK